MASPVGSSNDDDTPTGDTLRNIHTTTSMTLSASSTTTLPRFYEMQNGDTLTRIAETYGVPIAAIMERNAITNPRRHPSRADPRNPAPHHDAARFHGHRHPNDLTLTTDPCDAEIRTIPSSRRTPGTGRTGAELAPSMKRAMG
jgi:hypothetical protein